MVDAVVSFAVQRLGDFLIQQAAFLREVEDEVKWLKTELKMMQSLLEDAAEKQDGDQRIRQWISDVRDVAYDTEDVIDNFILKVEVERTQESTPKRGFLASVKKCSCICSCSKEIHKEVDLYNIGKEIEALKQRVVEISRRRGDYGIRNIGDVVEGAGGAIESLRQLRRTSPYADEDHIVGFEDVTASLVDELLKNNPRRCVISLFGMGGLGKTTLARKLYRDSKVEDKFEHRGWICVSQEYQIRDLLQRIIRSFKFYLTKEELEKLEKMTEEDLERYLHDFLTGRRYLVVIDDVWDKVVWESLRRAFPDNRNGSRVIVTTRIKAVAELSDGRTHVHELRFLMSEESWELFCKKAFPNQNATISDCTSQCPPALETLGREMVAKCGGLPLAIIVLGGLLSRKHADEWWKVKEHIWRDLRNDSIRILQLLTLSFNDLPYQLKPCFLYLGLFPEDSLINTEKLIHLWVAEGFIPQEEETLEEIAEDWLNELIGRSMIQVVERSWGRITTCRVHDLLRDLAVKKAKELNFLHIYDGIINYALSYRRQAAHSSIERYVSVDNFNPCLRTLLLFNPDTSPSNIQQLTIIHTKFKLLRVLDLHSIRFDPGFSLSLPDAVGELIHLRYLGLENTGINELPPSIVNLQALQTLNAYTHNTIVRLQDDICKLKQLRHLIGCFEGSLRVDHLTNLQSLSVVNIEDWNKINTVNLINLRELHLSRLLVRLGEPKEFTLEHFANLRNLQSLSMKLCSFMYISSFEPLSHCRRLLQLMINGKIENLPERMHEYLPNLKCLQLRSSQLSEDPMPTLEKLSNLMILVLEINDFKKLSCTAKGFPRLEVLKLVALSHLKELQVEEGALSMLRFLTIYSCSELVLPERLRLLPEDYTFLNPDW